MWESVGSFLSCSSKKKRAYEESALVHQTNGTIGSARQPEEMEPMIRQTGFESEQPPGRLCCCLPQSGPGKVCCECCCGCVCAILVALLVLFAFVTGTTSVEVESTKFTFWNYYLPQFKYLIAGQADTYSWNKWYRELASKQEPLVGVGPGPNTHTYYGWQDVKGILEDFAVRIRAGTMKRHNELGMTILSNDMWPETGTAVTGLTNSDHAAVRPYLGAALDGAEGAWDKNCDGSSCWNTAWLRHKFKERFGSLNSFTRDDLLWMISSILHKVHLNLDLSDAEMKDFAAFQQQLIRVVPFKRTWFWEMILGTFPKRVKQDFEDIYKAAIKQKWPEDPWKERPSELKVLASAMLDSLALIGGASVPIALDFLLALMFMEGEPGRSVRPLNLDDDAQLHNFIWETLRRYPPVSGVPRWITDDQGATWKHQIASVHQALQDPNNFPDPLEYRLGRPGLNHEDSTLSIGWAEFAMVNGDVSDPNSHSCPAKQLSFRMITAFLQEFEAAGPWEVDDPIITLNSYGSSGFTLRKSS